MPNGSVGNCVCHKDIPPEGVNIDTMAIVLKTALAIRPPPSVTATAVLAFCLGSPFTLPRGVPGGVWPALA